MAEHAFGAALGSGVLADQRDVSNETVGPGLRRHLAEFLGTIPGLGREHEFHLITGSRTFEFKDDHTAIKRSGEFGLLLADEQFLANETSIDSAARKDITLHFVDVALHPEAKAGATIFPGGAAVPDFDRHGKTFARLRDLVRERVNTSIGRIGHALGPAILDGPVLHRIGPKIAPEKNAVVGFVPAIEAL